jgi:hypothetical protein
MNGNAIVWSPVLLDVLPRIPEPDLQILWQLNNDMTPRQIVEYLNRHIVGQSEAKRAIAIAMRNRCAFDQPSRVVLFLDEGSWMVQQRGNQPSAFARLYRH